MDCHCKEYTAYYTGQQMKFLQNNITPQGKKTQHHYATLTSHNEFEITKLTMCVNLIFFYRILYGET